MDNYEAMQRARALYDSLIANYRLWKKGGVGDRKSRVDMISAAVGLAKLGLPNPFNYKELQSGASSVPKQGLRVTAVIKKAEEESNDGIL